MEKQAYTKSKCKPEVPEKFPSYSMAYIPFQCWGEIYDSETAFNRGTLFPDLDLPFIGEEPIADDRKK
ncbi:MAG: spore coat associated protein CotJA [Oscillospiraceae bacterium]|nr:spore coat associated protein CotJA [Oscillospiraceae bacterium]